MFLAVTPGTTVRVAILFYVMSSMIVTLFLGRQTVAATDWQFAFSGFLSEISCRVVITALLCYFGFVTK